jgi:hypothetical protein
MATFKEFGRPPLEYFCLLRPRIWLKSKLIQLPWRASGEGPQIIARTTRGQKTIKIPVTDDQLVKLSSPFISRKNIC